MGAHALEVGSWRAFGVGLQAAALFLLARILGPDDLGLFSLVLLVQSLVAVVANVGVFAVAQYHAATRERPLDRVVSAGLIAMTVATVVLVPPLSFTLAWLHPLVLPGLSLDLLVLALLAGPLRIGFETLAGAFIGMGSARAQARLGAVGPVAFVAPLLAAAAVGRLDLSIAVRIWVLSQVIALAVAAAAFRRASPLAPPRTVARDRGIWRDVLALGSGAYLVYLAFWASARLDRAALNVVGGSEVLGSFAIAAWISESFMLIPGAVANVLYPRLADAARGTGSGEIARAVRATIGVLALLAVPTVPVVGLATLLFAGPAFGATAPLLAVLLPGQIVGTTVVVIVNMTIARREPAIGALYYAITAVSRVILILTLFAAIGLLATMAAVGVASLAIAIVAGIHLARLLRCDLSTILIPRPSDMREVVRVVATSAARAARRSL